MRRGSPRARRLALLPVLRRTLFRPHGATRSWKSETVYSFCIFSYSIENQSPLATCFRYQYDGSWMPLQSDGSQSCPVAGAVLKTVERPLVVGRFDFDWFPPNPSGFGRVGLHLGGKPRSIFPGRLTVGQRPLEP